VDATDTQGAVPPENLIGTAILDAAMRVHSHLGPGLLESAYIACLTRDLSLAGLKTRREVPIRIDYRGVEIANAYRLDLLVEERVVVEAKAIDSFLPVHRAQLLSYLKLGHFRLGYLLNFNAPHMRNGIIRLVNGL